MEFVEIIQTIGFPIACVIACFWFIVKNVERDRDESKNRENRLMESNEKNTEALAKVAETIETSNEINKELSETNKTLADTLNNKLTAIDKDIHKVLDKLE